MQSPLTQVNGATQAASPPQPREQVQRALATPVAVQLLALFSLQLPSEVAAERHAPPPAAQMSAHDTVVAAASNTHWLAV